MDGVVTLIQEVGFPIAAALGLGWFIYKLIMRIVDGMETKLDEIADSADFLIEGVVIFPAIPFNEPVIMSSRILLNSSELVRPVFANSLRAPSIIASI